MMAKSKSSPVAGQRASGEAGASGYFDYDNPYIGVSGEPSTQKQRDYINSLLESPFDRASATLRLGTLPEASSLNKRAASYLIDDLKMHRDNSMVRLKGEDFSKSRDELSAISYMREQRQRASLSGKSLTQFVTRSKEAADEYNGLSSKWGLGVTYTVKERKKKSR